jgi:hypothetical protein
MSLTNFEDDFLRIRNRPDQYAPEIEHRRIERVQVGAWLFGLLPVYEYRYTDWEKNTRGQE